MAEALSSAAVGHNLSRASFLDFSVTHSEIERELQDAQETVRSIRRRRKDHRKNMAAAGVDVDMFDRMLADLELTDDERRSREFEYQRYMQWREKPVGFQPSMDLQTDDPDERALNVHELHAVDGEGYDAGKFGRRRDSNPFRPGSEPHQRWDNAWGRGQAAAVAEMGQPAAASGYVEDAPPEPPEAGPKRRGWPKGRPRGPRKAASDHPNGNGNGAEPDPEEDPAEEPQPGQQPTPSPAPEPETLPPAA